MTSVQLTKDLECFIGDAVRAGRYSNAGEVISDALIRLRNAIDTNVEAPDESAVSSGAGKKLTRQGLHQHLVKIGLLGPPPDTDPAAGNLLNLIDGEDEIIDEVVIRERLIEWLTSFLGK
jgi:putative addiction module CopG family antidote